MKTFRSLHIHQGTGPGFYFNVDIEKEENMNRTSLGRFDNLAAIFTYMSKEGWEYMSHEEVDYDDYLTYKALFYQETK